MAPRSGGVSAPVPSTELGRAVDSLPVGIFAARRDGRIVFANQTLAGWLEADAARLVGGANLLDFVASGEASEPDEAGNPALKSGEVRLRALGGEVFPTTIEIAAPAAGADNAIQYGLIVNHAGAGRFGDRRRAARSSRFFDEAPIGIVMIDVRDEIVESNIAFRSMIGAEEVGPETALVDLVLEDDRAQVAERLTEARRGAHPDGLEIRIAGAGERTAQLHASAIEEASGVAADMIVYLVDTTGRKSLEEQFAQSQKMQAVSQLAGGIAHDFNNLLTAMIGFCDLLFLRHGAGDQSFGDIMQIKQNANRAANLVRQLLAFSRQQTLQPRVLVLTDVLAELTNLLRRLIGETIELKMVHSRDIGLVKVDQGQFEQVVINIVVNARDAMPDGGTLTIRTENITLDSANRYRDEIMSAGDYVLIEMSDTGTGISEANLDKIFDPFYTTKAVGAGTGLGLSTVYGIVKQTGGFIFAYSEIGAGTTFKIFLPRYVSQDPAELVETAASDAAPMRDLTGSGTILLVEDEAPVRQFAARALANKGYTVLEAENGEVALGILGDHDGTIEMLVTDVVMPNMDGPTLIRRAREDRPAIKAILISGYAEDVFRSDLDGDLDAAFLPKPFSLKELLSTVKTHFEGG